MTYFEYVSIAISLIFAFATTDILRSLIPLMTVGRRYFPHYVWVVSTFALIVYVWMYLWRVQSIDWTGPMLFYAMINPAITTLMARLLTTPSPESVQSFREHFHKVKRAYFFLLLAFGANAFVFDWVIGQTPWGTLGEAQFGALFGMVISIFGLTIRNDRFHHYLAPAFLLMIALLVAQTPAYA